MPSDLIHYRTRTVVATTLYNLLISNLIKASPEDRYGILVEVFKSVREQLHIEPPASDSPVPQSSTTKE